jgi:hypothetical protein
MSQQWLALVRQLCTPSQQAAVSAIASSRLGGRPTGRTTTADVAGLARRFGLSSGAADAWARGSSAAAVLGWPSAALDLVDPSGIFEQIGLDDAVAVLDRLSRMVAEETLSDRAA